MLTRKLAIATIDGGLLRPDRLMLRKHAAYRGFAERMLAVFNEGVGKCRFELHRAVGAILAGRDPLASLRAAAFCKLLDDCGKYDCEHARAMDLRSRVFLLAAKFHPLLSEPSDLYSVGESEAKERIARELGIPWEQIARSLFCDLPRFNRLQSFRSAHAPRELLARYNVAQTRVALLDAVHLTVRATADFKSILRYAKLAGLMHSIVPDGPGAYIFGLSGPGAPLGISRGGVSMSNFLPGLLACRGWKMSAKIRRGMQALCLELADRDGLSSCAAPPEPFDSTPEAVFARTWGDGPRQGWRLERETEIIHSGQSCFFPDFAFENTNDGRRVLFEVIGFWTKAYLEAKRRTLERLRARHVILALSSGTQAPQVFRGIGLPCLLYKKDIKVADVLALLGASYPREVTA